MNKLEPNTYFTFTRNEMIEFVPEGSKKILDIGCGAGAFGTTLKSLRHAEVWGVENYQSAAALASEKLDKVISGDFETNDIILPQKYFDCAIFNDVLEHFRDPWKALIKVADFITDDGYIVASLPNVRFYDNIKNLIIKSDWKYVDAGILDRAHLRFFTLKSMQEMFSDCGYRIIKTEGINSIELPFRFKVLNKVMKNRFGDMKFNQFAIVAKKNIRPER